MLALLEVVVPTVVCLASSPWDLSDTSIEGRGFEAENDGTMKTLAGFPSAPDLVAKGTITVVAAGLLVRDSALASWVGLLVTTLVEVVMIETLTSLPSLAVVATTGVVVMPELKLDVVLTAIGDGSSRVLSVASAPSGPTILVDVTDGLDEMVLPEGSTVRKVVLLIVGPGGVTTTIFAVRMWVVDVTAMVFVPMCPKSSAIREASMLAELLLVEVEVVDDEGEAVGDGVESVGDEVKAEGDEMLAVIVVLKVVVATTGTCGAM